MSDQTRAAVDAVRKRASLQPLAAIVLGSGLGGLADEVREAKRIPYGDIPGWERSTAPGHAGELVVGTLSGKPVAGMKGRLHYYEGYPMIAVSFPIRVFRAWGSETVILTNAAGGLNTAFNDGDHTVINDHI